MARASRVHVSIPLPLLLLFLSVIHLVSAIKFNLPAFQYPPTKCIWNTAHTDTLVIVTANVRLGENQRVDVNILDSSENKNIYLSKKGIKGETRLAITTHADGEVGVCFKNYLQGDVKFSEHGKLSSVIDLDIDIGADAVDYNAIANQESLSALETEMRKLEGLVKEVVDEMGYLKKREERFTHTNFSTSVRVQNFAWFTILSLTGLGIWQIFHLRAFFKRKYLID